LHRAPCAEAVGRVVAREAGAGVAVTDDGESLVQFRAKRAGKERGGGDVGDRRRKLNQCQIVAVVTSPVNLGSIKICATELLAVWNAVVAAPCPNETNDGEKTAGRR